MTVDDVKRTRPDVPIVIVGGSGGPVTGKIAGEVPAYVGDPPSSSTVAEVVTLAGIYHLEWDRKWNDSLLDIWVSDYVAELEPIYLTMEKPE